MHSRLEHEMKTSDEVQAPTNFIPEKSARWTICRVWVGPRTGLEMTAKRKIPASIGNRTPALQPLANHLSAELPRPILQFILFVRGLFRDVA